MALGVVGLHLRKPRIDLAHPEPKLTADPKAARSPALATQVIDGLDADPELGGELRHRDDGIEPWLR